MHSTPTRRLDWDACYNARDLGGYPLKGGGATRWGALVRADNLCRLSQTGRQSLLDYGIRTIIDLRSPGELDEAPHPFSPQPRSNGAMDYISIPIIDDDNRPAIARLEMSRDAREGYRLLLEHFHYRFTDVLRAIAAAPEGGVLFHCHAGKDRTGLVAALLLALSGVPERDIAADYALSNQYLQPLYEEVMSGAPSDPREREKFRRSLQAQPANILSALSFLKKKYGGVEGYLRSTGNIQSVPAAGLSPAEIERLRERLTAPPTPEV